MRSIRDYLNLTEQERHILDAMDQLPPELIPLFEKFICTRWDDFDQLEKELEAIAEIRGLKKPKDK